MTDGRIVGPFEVERLLGRGRHGPTWLAVAPDERRVALREIRCASAARASAIETDPETRRICRVLRGLSHAGLARNLAVMSLGRCVYVAEELIEDPPLSELLEQVGALEPDEAWAICCQVLSALEFGQLRGLLHLDVRPGNIHYDRDTQHVTLTDLGHMQLALGLRDDLRLSAIADEYQAPEIHGGAEPTGASEVFSVGAVLHELLTGRLPDRPDLREGVSGRFGFLEVEGSGEPAPDVLLERVEEQAPGIVAVVRRALQSDPAERYDRAGRMHQALARARRADTEGVEFEDRGAWALEEGGADDEEAQARREVVEGGVQFCQQCGRPLRAGERVCGHCGTPRSGEEPVTRLPPQRREPGSYFQRHGDRLLSSRRFAEAADAYRMEAERSPDSAVAQRDLGDALMLAGRPADAAEAYRRALRLGPDDLHTRYELGRALLQANRAKRAAYELRKVVDAEPDEALLRSARLQLGAALGASGEHDRGREVWYELLADDPTDVRAHYLMGVSYQGAGDLTNAHRHLREAVKHDPNFADAREVLRQVTRAIERGGMSARRAGITHGSASRTTIIEDAATDVEDSADDAGEGRSPSEAEPPEAPRPPEAPEPGDDEWEDDF